jgi:putative transposase
MQVSPSAYYDWKQRPARLISPEELNLYRRAKWLFQASRNSLGSRELCKKLRAEGFEVGREKTRRLMHKLGLKVKQRQAYRVTTQRKKSDAVADNLLNQNFNPVAANEIWAGDITYRAPSLRKLLWKMLSGLEHVWNASRTTLEETNWMPALCYGRA